MKQISDIYYTSDKSEYQMLDLYLPDIKSFPVLIFFHGGGMKVGRGSRKGNKFYAYLSQKGVGVISADYRCYPDAAYPDYIEDAAAAVAWAYNNMKNYGNPTGFFIGGSSAGAYLSEMLCFDRKYLNFHGIDPDSINGYIHDAGQPTTHFSILEERGIDKRRVIIDEAAPLYHICDGRNYPPMQIFISDNDMPSRLEQTQLMISTLKNFEYDTEKIDFRLMENHTHTSYVNEQDKDGNFIFADMMYEFILVH